MKIESHKILTISRIPSRLYYALFKEGGDNLLSVYCSIKAFKGEQIKFKAYKSKNNKFVGGYSLLRSKTNISLSTLKRYVPVLENMGLLKFEVNGDVSLLGNNKLKSLYGEKIVPVPVCMKLVDTRYACMTVRLHSAQQQQYRMIEKKANLRELLLQGVDAVKNLRQLKAFKKAVKKYGNDASKLNYTDQTVLSVQGYAFLKHHKKDNKSLGNYYKKKLKEKGIVSTNRRFKEMSGYEPMSYSEFLFLRKVGATESKVVYRRNRVMKELTSSFTPINIIDIFNISSSNLK